VAADCLGRCFGVQQSHEPAVDLQSHDGFPDELVKVELERVLFAAVFVAEAPTRTAAGSTV